MVTELGICVSNDTGITVPRSDVSQLIQSEKSKYLNTTIEYYGFKNSFFLFEEQHYNTYVFSLSVLRTIYCNECVALLC